MINQIREFFVSHIAPQGAGDSIDSRGAALASTALLVEMMQADRESLVVEKQVIVDTITGQFGVSHNDANELMALAERELSEATDYFQFTSLINDEFSSVQKLQVLESLWLVAYADEEISAHERHLMRKLADLLHMPHGDHMLAKDRARQRAQEQKKGA